MLSLIPKKTILIFLILSFIAKNTEAQKNEYSANVVTGLFSFRGSGAASADWIIDNPQKNPPTVYTRNPYGKKSGFSYVIEVQFQRVTANNIIYGAALSFESLTSKVDIDTVFQNSFAGSVFQARGNTNLKNSFITLNPFAGYRFRKQEMNFDFTAGIDIAACVKSREKGRAVDAGSINYFTEVMTDNQLRKPPVDLRARMQLKVSYKKYGILAGYSLGLTDYQRENNLKAYSSFIRVGLSYQLK